MTWPSAGLALGLMACACGPSLPAGFGSAEAAAFQREHERGIGSEGGPLSAVASYYVGPGQGLSLGVVEGVLSETSKGDGPRLRIEVTEDGARCLSGCGPAELALDERQTTRFGRFSIVMSPQSGTLRVLVLDPQAGALEGFDGLRWFPVDAEFIVPARFEPAAERITIELATSRGLTKSLVRAGVLRAKLGGEAIELQAFQLTEGAPLLVPLTDRTSGGETYPVGRYLEVEVPVDGVAALDFNRLTNPWCAYSEHFNCPIPPPGNRLAVAVEAGERTWADH